MSSDEDYEGNRTKNSSNSMSKDRRTSKRGNNNPGFYCQQADPLAEDLQFCAAQEKEVSSEQEEEEEKTEKNREGEGEDLEYEEEGKGKGKGELKEIVSGKDLAPHATRPVFKHGDTVYAWWAEGENRVVVGTVVKRYPLKRGNDTWCRKYYVDFDKDNGNGQFDCDHGDLFHIESQCAEAYRSFK